VIASSRRPSGSSKKQPDGDLVIPLAPHDALLVEPLLDRSPLLRGDADGRVAAGAAGLVEGEAGPAQVAHDRMALRLDDPGSEYSLVEARDRVRVGRLYCDVVDPRWHAPEECIAPPSSSIHSRRA
jgi:hypothetical protein